MSTVTLVIAPFTLDPYCGQPGRVIAASPERPCIVHDDLGGYEIETLTGATGISTRVRLSLLTKTVPAASFNKSTLL